MRIPFSLDLIILPEETDEITEAVQNIAESAATGLDGADLITAAAALLLIAAAAVATVFYVKNKKSVQ